MAIRIVLNWDNKDKEYHLVQNLRAYRNEVVQYSLKNFDPSLFSSLLGKFILFSKYTKGAYQAVRDSKKDDVIIGTNFHVGAIASLFCILFRKKNNVLALNLILNDKSIVINFIRGLVLYVSFKNSNFYCTINDFSLIKLYSKYFLNDVDESRFFGLLDVYENKQKLIPTNENENYVFSGGETSRDWETLFNAANDMPNTKFICIARERLFPKLVVPKNVELIFDVSFKRFLEYLKKCSIVVLPVNSEGPSGLLVLFDATSLGKPTITTETNVVKNYIINQKYGTLTKLKDHESITQQIHFILNNYDFGKKMANEFRMELETNFSPKNYARNINDILTRMNKEL